MTTPSQRPTLPAPVDPTVARLDEMAVELVALAKTEPRNIPAERLAENACYELHRIAIALGLPGADVVARAILHPKLVDAGVVHEGNASTRGAL